MTNTAKEMFRTVLAVQQIDEDSLQKAMDLFEEYKRQGIIKKSTFEDNKWFCSDEYSNMSITFSLNELSYARFYKDIFGISYKDFLSYMKVYVMFLMGELVLNSIRDVVYDVHKLIKTDPQKLDIMSDMFFLHHPARVINFLAMLPEATDAEKMELLLNALDTAEEYRYSMNAGDTKRALASFDSYFLFNDIMNDYWKMDIPEEERLFYYPLYLWWQITGVIPLRPREFILTPRKCLNYKDDGWYLILRRNQIKGSERKISYKIENDYFKVEYKIPDKLADELLKYIEFTKKYESTELETLFITDTHYRQWKQKKHSNSRYFTYINLNCVMRYFYHEVIEKRYHMRIIYDREIKHLEEGCINYLYLGDTRHLALINIIAEGGTPVLAMMLAGHENIEMSAHYYSNITSLIECRTYKQYRKVLNGNVTYEISHKDSFVFNVASCVPLENGARCYSKSFANNDFTDCQKVAGPNGEIGYCPVCTYYRRKEDNHFFENDNFYKQKIEKDCKQLTTMINQVRADKGNSEDILQAMMKLQNSAFTYQQYQNEKFLFQKKEE